MLKIKESQVQSLVVKIKSSTVYCESNNEQFLSGFVFKSNKLTIEEAEIFSSHMRLESKNGNYFYLIDSNGLPMSFKTIEQAEQAAYQIKPNLVRQLVFSIFRKTGIKVLPNNELSDNIPIKFI